MNWVLTKLRVYLFKKVSTYRDLCVVKNDTIIKMDLLKKEGNEKKWKEVEYFLQGFGM